jgi:methionyl-tRNA synthetase
MEAEQARADYDDREFGKVLRNVMRIADRVNANFDKAQPWTLAKDPARRDELQTICSQSLQQFQLLTVLLAAGAAGDGNARRARTFRPRSGFRLDRTRGRSRRRSGPYAHLMSRIDPKQVDALLEGPKAAATSAVPAASAPPATPAASAAPTISIDDFGKIDLRIARIVAAEHVDGADKLIKLTLDVGQGRHRTVFAGIKSAYDPASLVGRLTPMVANLAPRKMKFGLSEGNGPRRVRRRSRHLPPRARRGRASRHAL